MSKFINFNEKKLMLVSFLLLLAILIFPNLARASENDSLYDNCDLQTTSNTDIIKNTTTGKTFESIDEAILAEGTEPGQNFMFIASGTYILPSNIPFNFTFNCDENISVTLDCTAGGCIAICPYGCTFEGITFNMGNSYYHGFYHSGPFVMNHCTFNGLFFSYSDMTFNSCVFNQDEEEYSMWDYAGNIEYNGCSFHGHGKFVNVYNEGLEAYTIKADDCNFESDIVNKSAFNVKALCDNDARLNFNVVIGPGNTTNDNFPTDKRLGSKLVMIDDGNSSDISIAFEDKEGNTTTAYPPQPEYIEVDISPEKTLSLHSALVAEPTLCKIVWGSLDDSICTVTPEGVIKKLKKGSCRIYVEDQNCTDDEGNYIRHEFNLDFPHLWFWLNGHGEGTIPESQWASPYDGEEQKEPPIPYEKGYIFEGWFEDEDLTIPFDATKPVLQDKTLYAKWKVSPVGEGWIFNEETGALTINGAVEWEDLPPWQKFSSKIKSITTEDSAAFVKTGKNAFSSASNLQTADLSKLDTSSVDNMSWMFSNCNNLTSLNISNFDTSNVTDMSYMFQRCQKLTPIDVSNFDTSKVTTMAMMFCGCWSIKSLDVSNFDTSKVINMTGMFAECDKLESLDLSNFNTSNVSYMSNLFYSSRNLTSIKLSSFDTSHVTNMYNMFYYCNKLTSLDVSNFDTSNVTDMEGMFYCCETLESLNVNNFNTSKVATMKNMFYGCTNLASLDVSNFDTSNVDDMNCMFTGCGGLKELDVSNFNTSKVTDISYMFSSCWSLEKLDLSKFNTSQVNSMYCVFTDCGSLKELDVSKFDTSQVNSMAGMFSGCSSLEEINISGFDTSQVNSMGCMFERCTNLTKIDVSKFNTSQLTEMYSIFRDCSNLKEIDLSSFDVSQITDMADMFNGCTNLNKIVFNKNFSTESKECVDIINDCTNLKFVSFTPSKCQNICDSLYELTTHKWKDTKQNVYNDAESLKASKKYDTYSWIGETPVTVTWPSVSSNPIYGCKLSEIELSGGSAVGPDKEAVAGTFTWNKPETIPTVNDAITTGYEITFTPTDTETYVSQTGIVKFKVTPKNSTIKADDKMKITGKSDPVLTATYEGFVNSEKPIINTDYTIYRESGESVGTYAIHIALKETSTLIQNYNCTTIDGKFTIADDEEGAFNKYKSDQIATVNAMVQDGDSDAVKDIIENAKKQISAINYDKTKTLDQNKAVVDAIVKPIPESLTTQRKSDFENFKKQQCDAAFNNMIQEGDSDVAKNAVNNAISEIMKITYDSSKTPASNKELLSSKIQSKVTETQNTLNQDRETNFEAYKQECLKAIDKLYEPQDIPQLFNNNEFQNNTDTKSIIDAAKQKLQNLKYDTSISPKDNKLAQDTQVTTLQDELYTIRNSDFEQYKADTIKKLQEMSEGASDEVKNLINKAIEEIKNMKYDKTKNLTDNNIFISDFYNKTEKNVEEIKAKEQAEKAANTQHTSAHTGDNLLNVAFIVFAIFALISLTYILRKRVYQNR